MYAQFSNIALLFGPLICFMTLIRLRVFKGISLADFPGQQLIYTERLSLTNLDSLESRRIKFDLLMYYKIINNLVDTDSSKFFTFVHHSFNTRGHGLKLTKKLYPTNALANTFANRCINCWNALPSSIVSSPTLAHFKMQLKKLTYPTIVWADIRGEITLSVHSK